MKHPLISAALVLIAAVLAGLLGCSSGPSSQEAALTGSGGGFEGSWSGVALMGTGPMHLELILSLRDEDSSRAQFEGTARVQPLHEYMAGRDFGESQLPEPAELVVVLDKRSHGVTVQVAPGRRRGARWTNGVINGRGGVFDATGQRIALIGSQPREGLGSAISLVRPAAFRKMAKGYKTFNQRGSGSARGIFKLLSVSFSPSDKKLRKWVQPALDALPKNALASAGGGSAERMAIPLFEDEHFKATFGTTFDQLSGKKLNAVFRDLGKNPSRNSTDAERALRALHRMFWTHIGSPSGVQTLQGLHALRGVKGWRESQARRLARMDGASEGWEDDWAIAEAVREVAGGAPASWAWPEDTAALVAAADSALGEMAYPVLASQLAALEEGSDQTTLRSLVNFSRGASKPWQFVNREKAAQLREQAASRIKEVSATLIQARVEELAEVGNGLDAVTRGNAWMRDLERDFGDVRGTLGFEAAVSRLRERRGRDLQAAEPQMLALVSRSDSGTLDSLVGTWFQAPGDRTHAVLGSVREAIEARKRELHANYERGIQEAVTTAQEESRKRPGQPLRYIDFRRFPSADFLEFIYYGTGKNRTQAEFLNSLSSQNLSGIWDLAKYKSKMKLAFANYHDLYYRRYGSTKAARIASRESWRGIVNTTTTVNPWGQPIDTKVDSEPFVYVRELYSNAYTETLVTEADGAVMFFGALFEAAEQGGSDRQMRRQFEQNLFGAILLTPTEYQAAFAKFLDEYKEAYPATVRHFEENLRRAFELETLRKIDVIQVVK